MANLAIDLTGKTLESGLKSRKTAAHPVTADRSAGVAWPSPGLTFRCEPLEHRVVALNPAGEVEYAFGGFGRGPGQFDMPLDVVVVRPEFFGEPRSSADDSSYAYWIAVADYGNKRIQIFETDGTLVGIIDDELIDTPLGAPCALAWRAPLLEVGGVDGSKARIHLGAALLGRGPAPAAMAAAFHVRAPRAAWEHC